jgi:ABC-type sugar transport system substrate-binding protein
LETLGLNERRLALFLPDSKNPYMQLSAELASVAAHELDIHLDVQFAEGDFTVQVRQVLAATRGLPRPRVLLVLPVQESSLKAISEQAVMSEIGWFWLSRGPGNHEELRRRFPQVPVTFVTPDQREAGRIQGGQLRALLQRGGRVLWIQGRMSNQSAQRRTDGTREVLNAVPGIEIVGELDGNWSADDTRLVVTRWLKTIWPTRLRPDAIACQSDLMATGALAALKGLASEMGDPSLASVPMLGCDGLRSFGRRMVDEGTLVATAVLPTTAERAVRLAAAFLNRGEMPPPELVLEPQPYPDEATMVRSLRSRHIA